MKLQEIDTGKLIKSLTEQTEAKITRPYYLQVMVEALIKLHPEVKDDPNVIDFYRRITEYEAKRNSE